MIYLKLRQAGEVVNHKRGDRLTVAAGTPSALVAGRSGAGQDVRWWLCSLARIRSGTLALDSSTIHAAVDEACIEKRISMHSQGHAFAARLLEQKVDIHPILVLLGHKKLEPDEALVTLPRIVRRKFLNVSNVASCGRPSGTRWMAGLAELLALADRQVSERSRPLNDRKAELVTGGSWPEG